MAELSVTSESFHGDRMLVRHALESENLSSPRDGKHRYFRVSALDTEPKLEPAASKENLAATIAGHVLAAGELIGTYER